jgi:glutaredoxin 3
MTNMANGARSVPQIFADNIHIGDCDKIYKLDQEKKLDKLLGLE